MAVLLSSLDVSGLLGAQLGDTGTEEERAYVEQLRAAGELTTTLLPTSDSGCTSDDAVDAGDGWELPVLLAVDPVSLPEGLDRVDQLKALDRVAARVAAKTHEVVAVMAGVHASASAMREMHVEHEVAVARRSSAYAARAAITTARALRSVFPGFSAALATGEVSQAHCSVLVHRTRFVSDDDVLVRIGELALTKARRMTPGQFGREVDALVVRFDRDADPRHRKAAASRHVFTRPLEDGLGMLGLVHEWSVVQAIHDAVQGDADRLRRTRTDATAVASSDAASADEGAGRDEVSRSAAIADALAARVLGSVDEDGAIMWDRSQTDVVAHLVIDLDTLRRERDNPVLLDGQPVPASIGRDLAGYAKAWRRIVTDPVTGASLDYGTLTYLPDRLRTYLADRDAGCRGPGCTTRAASRLQMDHALEWPAGASSAGNCGMLCTRCHQLKTARVTDITGRHPDGSFTWTTGWGQVVLIPPRPYLPGVDEPDDTGPPGDTTTATEPPDDDPPPGPPIPDVPPF